MKLTTNDQEKVTKTYTANTEAQQLYLKGRLYQLRRGIKNLEKAVEYYKQAIEKDPNYALAYTGLADTYVVTARNIGAFTPGYGNFRPREYMPQARQAVLKALELDENLAEAHRTLGQILLYDYDWEGAEREFKKAIELKPNYETAYLSFRELSFINRKAKMKRSKKYRKV